MQKEVLGFRDREAGRYALRVYASTIDRSRRTSSAGFAIPRPPPLRNLADSLKARIGGASAEPASACCARGPWPASTARSS
jgi:hypothetical protein